MTAVTTDAAGNLAVDSAHSGVANLVTRMAYDATHVFINGESFRAGGRDARLIRRLADRRNLGARDVARLSPEALALVTEWLEAGWLQLAAGETHDS